MDDFSYCPAWPEELKEAERQRYRAACKVRCLESMLDRVGLEEFDSVMSELEQARVDMQEAGIRSFKLRLEYERKDLCQ